MTAELAQIAAIQTGLVVGDEAWYVVETPTGLVFREDTPIEVWGPLVARLISQGKKIHWAIADAINFGDRVYGEMYAQWVEETGLAEKTLANIASVGRRIEPSRRREDVDFSHHEVVAKLPPEDQTVYLDLALEQGMSCFDLRQTIKADRESVPADASDPVCAADRPLGLGDLLPEWRQRAEASGEPNGYLAALLDTAAEACFRPDRWRD